MTFHRELDRKVTTISSIYLVHVIQKKSASKRRWASSCISGITYLSRKCWVMYAGNLNWCGGSNKWHPLESIIFWQNKNQIKNSLREWKAWPLRSYRSTSESVTNSLTMLTSKAQTMQLIKVDLCVLSNAL